MSRFRSLPWVVVSALSALSACDESPVEVQSVPAADFSGSWDLLQLVTSSTCDHAGRTETVSFTIEQSDSLLAIRDPEGDITGVVSGRTAHLVRSEDSMDMTLTISDDGNTVAGSATVQSGSGDAVCVDTHTISGAKITNCPSIPTGVWSFRLTSGSTGTLVDTVTGDADQLYCGFQVSDGMIYGVLHGDRWGGRGQGERLLEEFQFEGRFEGSLLGSFAGTWQAEGAGLSGTIVGRQGELGPLTPAELLDSFALALHERDFAGYEALLHDNFEFYILESDAQDFPWLEENFWTRTIELEIIGNMFDDNYSGEETPVQSIDVGYTLLAEEDLGGGVTQVIIDVIITVLVGPNDGWTTDTRLDMELVSDSESVYQIRTQREVLRLNPGKTDSAEQASWGAIKAIYR